MNYIARGLADLKYAIWAGVLIYAVFLLLTYALKKRKGFSWKCVPEVFFCIYGVLLLKLVGIFSLHFSLDGIISYNLIPFIGSSFIPVLLNFALFLPYGFLLPVVFTLCRWNWKKVLCVGASTSLTIELLQMFGGRYAEIDDFLINTLGALVGYLLYAGLRNFRKNRKKTLCAFVVLAAALGACFSGIYFVGDHAEPLPDGFSAVQNNISEIRIYYKGEKQVIETESELYNHYITQISNCGGHLLEIDSISDGEIMNDTDCFIEILFETPQNISFRNAEDFIISNADRVMYNASKNVIYWGCSYYQYLADYTKFDAELQEHKADILAQYRELQEKIIQCFE